MKCNYARLRRRHAISFGFALVLLIAAVAPAQAQRRNNDYYTSQGTELLAAVEKFHLAPGEQKLKARRYDAAYADFNFILNYFPNHPQVLLLMGETCDRWKSPQCHAEEFFRRGIDRRPDVAGTYAVYGIYLTRSGKWNDGIVNLKRALELDPNSINAHYNIALAYIETKQYELANEHAQKAYALGAPLPGLRDSLKRSGHWQPLQQPTAGSTTGTPSVPDSGNRPAKPAASSN